MLCDNINNVHDNLIINQTEDGLRVICKHCKQINVLRMERNGRFNNRQYSEIFKRDILQRGSNLYYKIHDKEMSVI